MNESSLTSSSSPLEEGPLTAPVLTAGALLQQARERAGVHLGMLSVALKVPVRHLMALEADDHSPFSSPVFVRALTSSVCRNLRVEAEPILALLPRAPSHLQGPPPDLDAPNWRRHSSGRRGSGNRQFVLWALVLMVLIGLVVGLPPATVKLSELTQAPSVVRADEAASPSTPETLANSMVVLMPSESMSQPEPGRTSIPVPTAGLAVTNKTDSPALEVTFRGKADEAWVEVKDSSGALVFNKLVKSGETHVVKGVPVLTVVVGLADAVDVLVRGQPLDLTPFSRGAVARFEVK